MQVILFSVRRLQHVQKPIKIQRASYKTLGKVQRRILDTNISMQEIRRARQSPHEQDSNTDSQSVRNKMPSTATDERRHEVSTQSSGQSAAARPARRTFAKDKHLCSAISSLRHRQQRLAEARSVDLSLGTELQHQWEIQRQAQDYLKESTQALMQHMDATMRKSSVRRSMSRLHKLHEQVQTDHATEANQIAKAKQLEIRRAQQSVKLQDMESALDRAVTKILAMLSNKSIARDELDPDLSTAGELKSASRSVHAHPLLERYYDKAGDLSIMRERFSELQELYTEDRERRTLLADQDEALELSEVDFELSYALRSRQAEQNVLNAIEAHQDALKACVDAGLGIAIPEYARESTEAEIDVMITSPKNNSPAESPVSSQASRLIRCNAHTLVHSHRRHCSTAERDVKVGSSVAPRSILSWIEEVEKARAEMGISQDHVVTPLPPSPAIIPSSSVAQEISQGQTWLQRPESPSLPAELKFRYNEYTHEPGLKLTLEQCVARRKRSSSEGFCHYLSKRESFWDNFPTRGSCEPQAEEGAPRGITHFPLLREKFLDSASFVKDYFRVGLIFMADIASLIADEGTKSLDLSSKKGYLLDVYVVIEQHDADFVALAMDARSMHRGESLLQSRPSLTLSNRDSIVSVQAIKMNACHDDLSSSQHNNLLSWNVVELLNDTSVDLDRYFAPLEYNSRQAHCYGEVEKNSLGSLITRWNEGRQQRMLHRSWMLRGT